MACCAWGRWHPGATRRCIVPENHGSTSILAEPSEERITRLLDAAAGAEPGVLDRLFDAVYDHLRALARRQRRRLADRSQLATTELVHEAYLRLFPSGSGWANRGHFFATAARAMRQILINAAEAKRAAKRGGGSPHRELLDVDLVADQAVDDLLALDQALRRLEQRSARQGQVVECRFFAGLDVDETAAALGISPATVKRDWSLARAWLYRELGAGSRLAAGAST